jgi:hypothetical protein
MIACCIAGAGACQRSSKAISGVIRTERTTTVNGRGLSICAGVGAFISEVRTNTAAIVHAHHRAPDAAASLVGNFVSSSGCMFAHASRAPAAFLMATKNSPRINRGELIFFKPYDVTFRISGGQLHFLLRFHRLADDAPYFIGCGAAMNESARAKA